ncbi:MAG TPA: pitrilysin family protein [Polyangiales bacterium]
MSQPGLLSHERTLPNGLRVVVVPQRHLAGATLSVFVKVGPRYERLEYSGLSHFLEHMLFRGTRRFDSTYALSFASESLGGMIEAATYADFTHFQLSVPAEHAREALAMLADLLAAPRFQDLLLEKQIVREEILADLDADGREVDAENLSRMLIFGQHPLGFKITGDADTIDRFTLDDLRAHMQRHYGASNMALVATGNVEPAAVFEDAERLFAEFPVGRATLVDAPPPARHDEHLRFVDNEASQTEVRLCFRALGAEDPDFMALRMLSRVLDDGMSTRLHRRMTDESGLAYDVFGALDPYEEVGVLEIGASVAHEKLPEVVSAGLSLMSELCFSEVEPAELEKARTRYRWSLRRIVDSAEDMAMYAGTQSVFGRPLDLKQLLAEVEGVTRADLMRVARRVVRPEGTHVLAVGKIKRAVQVRTRKAWDAWAAEQSAKLRW